ncbi:hypothetical protein [Halanaerobium hydrogeniformans]|uniref:Protein kinase domain-containing protein n=1 Tax=Halanaerobium hydrogeniformans TaxID=656519 RepID=E4RNL8_HALHG|nr:hypothetical protein [Halanaerobium hydrogeniformans]ADQ13553.1 hypothetical protein Halsa_0057 [Halanaerobium hydrogeniformans]
MNKITNILGRIYWKINRIYFKLTLNKKYNYWQQRKDEILEACKNGYIKDIESLDLNIEQNNDYIEIGEIDERGRVMSAYNINDRKKVTKNCFIKRRKNDLYIVSLRGKAGIKKNYRGNKYAFLKELRGLYYSNLSKINVPAIMDIDFDKTFIILSYIKGRSLQNFKTLSDEKKIASKLTNHINKIHGQGIYLNDLTPKNIIIEPNRGPFIIDFEMSAHKSELGVFYKYFTKIEKEKIKKLF